MNLTAIQLPARFDAFGEQLRAVELLLEAGPRTDLVLLPEAALTGYVSTLGDFDLTRFAEALEGPTHQALAQLARRFECLIIGPLIEREGSFVFNSMIGITPTGERLVHYRKRHPWMPEKWATAGTQHAQTFEWKALTFSIAVCFDVHFLEEDAAAQLDASDVLLFPSAWVDDEDDSRVPLLRGLAVARGCSVLNANWGVGRPRVPGQGGSMFVDRSGVLTERLAGGLARLDARG